MDSTLISGAEPRRNGVPPRSLLLMLEEERTRNLQLETEVHQLRTEVETQQGMLKNKMARAQQDKAQALAQLQKLADAKQEECMQLAKKLGQATTKHADDVLLWSSRTEKLDASLAAAQGALHQAEANLGKQEKALAESQAQRQRLHEKLVKCERVLAKHVSKMKDKDLALQKEKETRMQVQVQVLEMEHQIQTRSEELQQFQKVSKQCSQLNQEKELLALQLSDMKQKHALEVAKAKCLSEDLEKSQAKERQMKQTLEEQTLDLQKKEHEIERLQFQLTTEQQEHKQCQEKRTALQQEVQGWLEKQREWHREKNQAQEKEKRSLVLSQQVEREQKNSKVQMKEALQNVSQLETQLAQLKAQLEQKERQLQSVTQEKQACMDEWGALHAELQQTTQAYHATESLLSSERNSVKEIKLLVKEIQEQLQVKQQKVQHLEQQLRDTQEVLQDTQALVDRVQKEHQQSLQSHHQAVEALQSQTSHLEQALMEATMEKTSLQNAEKRLGDVVGQREELITGLSDQIRHLENKVAQLRPFRDQVTSLEVQLLQRKEEMHNYERQWKDLLDAKERLEQAHAKLRLEYQSKDHTVQLLKMELEATKKSVTRLKEDLAKSHRFYEYRQQRSTQPPPPASTSASQASKLYDPSLLLMDLFDSNLDLDKEDERATTIDGMDEFMDPPAPARREEENEIALKTTPTSSLSSLNSMSLKPKTMKPTGAAFASRPPTANLVHMSSSRPMTPSK